LDQRLELKTRRGIGNLISAMDQGVDGRGEASEVAAQRAVARLDRGGDSLEPGIAHAVGHRFG
jgi:hypothetical protein